MASYADDPDYREPRQSPNFDDRPEGTIIDTLVIHYTGMETGDAALERLCDPEAEVSAHYMIEENGRIHKLVPEVKRAWHAGISFWRGEPGVNARSIGIELVNPGHEFGYRKFPEEQIKTLTMLCQTLVAKFAIPHRNVVGHSDVAPKRKDDPGELFPWEQLAQDGVGLWPVGAEHADISDGEAQALLSEYGYETDDLEKTIMAFQRHFRPGKVDGVMDADCAGRLKRLVDFTKA